MHLFFAPAVKTPEYKLARKEEGRTNSLPSGGYDERHARRDRPDARGNGPASTRTIRRGLRE
jgi:hypothetical protein